MSVRGHESPSDLWCVTHLAHITLEELFEPAALERLERIALYKTICVLRQQNKPLYGVVAAGGTASYRDHL